MHPWLALGAPTYTLRRTQWLPQDAATLFQFFQDPQNLPRITPAWLDFHITGMDPDVIAEKTLITYRLRWLGFPYNWKTVILDWVPPAKFVDTQLSGPYILWHHTHTFTPASRGVVMDDTVRYRLPFGPAGMLLHALLIRRQLSDIFDYRAQKIAAQFSDGVMHSACPAQ